MTDLTKVKAARILFSARFWVATMVLYLTSRNISTGVVFQLLGFYYVLTVLLEYPTGVIGDYYSHRLSVFWGYVTLAIAYILLSFSGTIWFYASALSVLALGQTLISGSDTALLHTASADFKKDYTQIKTYGIIVSFAAISIGGFVSAIDLRIPLYLTAIFLLGAAVMVFLTKIKVRGKTEGSNFVSAGIDGLKYAFNNKKILNILIVSSLIGAFFFSFKWLYNPLFLKLGLDIPIWGILAGAATLLIAAGTKIYGKFSKANIIIAAFVLVLAVLAIGAVGFPAVALGGMFLSHLMRGYFETRLMVNINSAITKFVRASILSLNSLLIRAGATVFMSVGGILLDKASITALMSLSVLIFVAAASYSLFKIKRFEKETVPVDI